LPPKSLTYVSSLGCARLPSCRNAKSFGPSFFTSLLIFIKPRKTRGVNYCEIGSANEKMAVIYVI
ncbi:hypothetical protein, partial [Salmonella enterica]|uniref:hypothetical protein n=1 Tax=Salmonella enterica TaxID=28901 RepID=UPI001C9975C8